MKLKKILQFAFGPMGAALISFALLPFITWFFSNEDVGRFSLLQASVSFGVMLFSLAMHQAYVREYHEEDNKAAVFKTAIMPGLLAFCVLFIVLALSPWSISQLLFGETSLLYSVLVVIAVFAAFIINMLNHVLRMQERGVAYSTSILVPKVALALFVGLAVLFATEYRFDYLIGALAGSWLVSLLVFALFTRDTWVAALRSPFEAPLARRMLTYSLPLVAGSLAYWGLTTSDKFILRALSSFEELGVYAVAVTLAGAVSVLTNIFSNLWHPTVYKWVKQGVQASRIEHVMQSMLIVILLMWAIVGMFSWLVLWILPESYAPVRYLLVACISMPLFYLMSETTVVGINITRRSVFSLLASLGAFCLNIVLNILLIPQLGAVGAAAATVIAFYVFFLIRTEASAQLWHKFARLKMYGLLTLFTLFTLFHLLFGGALAGVELGWLVLALVAVGCCRRELSMVLTTAKAIKQGQN